MIEIIYKGWFPSLNHIYGTRGNRRYLLPKVGEYRHEFQMTAWQQYRGEVLTCDVSVIAELTFGDKRKRDIQNCLKIELDALNGFVYEDDSQIVALYVYKRYCAKKPEIRLRISEFLGDKSW